MRITGTFLDEITHDIPSNNWGREEWAKDFEVMKSIGIDTVILIRAGVGRIAACPSKVLQREVGTYPVYKDLVDMFLSLAGKMAWIFSLERTIRPHTPLEREVCRKNWILARPLLTRSGNDTATEKHSRGGI